MLVQPEVTEVPALATRFTFEGWSLLAFGCGSDAQRSIPQAVAAVVDRSLRDEESRRYRSAASMRRALLRAVEG